MVHNETVNMLAMIPLFAGLDRDALLPLAGAVRQVTLPERTVLFEQGDPGSTLYLVVDGTLKVYLRGEDDQETVLDIIVPDQVLGEMALIDGKPRSASAVALSDCTLLALDREPFMEHLEAHPKTAIHLLQYLCSNLRQRVLQAEVPAMHNSAARLAHAILFLAERDGSIEPGLVTSALRKKDLAAAIGTSEAWVTQMLDQWSRDGIIGMTGTRRLLLHDVAALVTLSERED